MISTVRSVGWKFTEWVFQPVVEPIVQGITTTCERMNQQWVQVVPVVAKQIDETITAVTKRLAETALNINGEWVRLLGGVIIVEVGLYNAASLSDHWATKTITYTLAATTAVIGIVSLWKERFPLPPIAPRGEGSPLTKAIHGGDLKAIIAWQKGGGSLETVEQGYRPMQRAIAVGNRQMVDLLWYYGCDLQGLAVNIENQELRDHVTALSVAKNRFALTPPLYCFYPPENLVFKGGGPKGIAYVGVQYALEERGMMSSVRRVAGTSAGAINAVLVALGYTAAEMERIIGEKNLLTFLDHPLQEEQQFIQAIYGVVAGGVRRPTIRQLTRFFPTPQKLFNFYHTTQRLVGAPAIMQDIYAQGGLCPGTDFQDWIDGLIEAKIQIKQCTFGEFKRQMEARGFKHIYLRASKIEKESTRSVCFNSEESQWDDVVISDMVRASMSIPILFRPHILRVKRHNVLRSAPELGQFLDGGILNNFPLNEFDEQPFLATNMAGRTIFNPQTLGFNLVDPPIERDNDVVIAADVRGVLQAVFNTYLNQQDILLEDQSRVVDIDNQGVGLVTGFAATPEQKQALIQSGRDSVNRFIELQIAQSRDREIASSNPKLLLSREVLRALSVATPSPVQNLDPYYEDNGSDEILVGRRQDLSEYYEDDESDEALVDQRQDLSKYYEEPLV